MSIHAVIFPRSDSSEGSSLRAIESSRNFRGKEDLSTRNRGFFLPLVDGTVGLDVDDIANPAESPQSAHNVTPNCQVSFLAPLFRGISNVLVLPQVSGEGDLTLPSEVPREGML